MFGRLANLLPQQTNEAAYLTTASQRLHLTLQEHEDIKIF